MTNQHIYLDNHATTPTDPRVVEAMAPWWSTGFGNPHSGDHWFGWTAHKAVEDARSKIAVLIGAEPTEIVFTSGATEANNLAILGAARARQSQRKHVIVSAIEHKCVLESAAELQPNGFTVDVVAVDKSGRVCMEDLAQLITVQTAVVSVMAVNNEIGTVQPIAEIGRLCQSKGAWFHCDAVQAPAATSLDVMSDDIDLLSLSSHKIYGPMGIGSLYARSDILPKLTPTTFGGGQESGLRSGTVPTPLVVGFGEAATLIGDEDERGKTRALRDRLWAGIREISPSCNRNGDARNSHPGNLSVTFPSTDASALIGALQPQLAISTGSACTTGIPEPSHVLTAIGLTPDEAECSVRFGVGRFTTLEEIDLALDLLSKAIRHIEQAVA